MAIGSQAERDAKNALRRGSFATCNIYLANPTGDATTNSVLGWATFPWGECLRPWPFFDLLLLRGHA
jgi:hypothetical protein